MSSTLSFSLLPLPPNRQLSPATANYATCPLKTNIHHNTIKPRHIFLVRNNQTTQPTTTSTSSAATVVRQFYAGINTRDLTSVAHLIADDCVYEDLVFPHPFLGRTDILKFFEKFTDSVGPDLQFVIDEVSEEDTRGAGVTWHLEWNGRAFPFSRGCSFYRLNGEGQIVYGRDSVEPAVKPGETALLVIRAVAWLLQRFPSLAQRL